MSGNTEKKKLTICLGIHNHQPTGNFDFVFEHAAKQCYRPLVQVIAQCEKVKWTFHFSGPLLLWLRRRDPELLADVRGLVEKGQVEILGSGVGEPVLPVLPPRDVRTQVDEMRVLCRELLGAEFRGIWLTERVWEPALAATLSECGVEYTFVDDHHFMCAGVNGQTLSGYYTTEKYGRVLKIFPISERLRYLIPFTPLDQVVEQFKEIVASGPAEQVLCCMDDGEKFGLWPGTWDWVFGKGWLAQFVERLSTPGSFIETALPSEIVDRTSSQGRVALPTTSYREMTEWALPLEAAKMNALKKPEKHQPCGYWDQFLTKYEEANRLHKRMLLTSDRVARLTEMVGQNGSQPAKRVREARHQLHMGQCNDAFWHGLFGGLYLPFLRAGVFESLIQADMLLDEVEQERGAKWVDFDCDGQNEWFVRTADQTIVIRPTQGGCLYLWEDHLSCLNLSDVLTRREELYHKDVSASAIIGNENHDDTAEEGDADAPCTIHAITASKERGLEDYLLYDRYPRYSGRVFVTKNRVMAEELRQGDYFEVGDLGGAHFQVEDALENGEGYNLKLSAKKCNIGAVAADLVKTVVVPKSGVGFKLGVALTNPARFKSCRDERLCLELDVTLNAIDEHRKIVAGRSNAHKMGEQFDVNEEFAVGLRDEFRNCNYVFESSRAADIAVYPLETVSTSESGFERTLQGLSIVFSVPLASVITGEELSVIARRESSVEPQV